jgi:hypothetical protein
MKSFERPVMMQRTRTNASRDDSPMRGRMFTLPFWRSASCSRGVLKRSFSNTSVWVPVLVSISMPIFLSTCPAVGTSNTGNFLW